MGTYSEIYIKCHRDKVQQVTTWLKECNINDCFTLKNPDSDYPTFVTDYIKWYGTYSTQPERSIEDFISWISEQKHITLLEVTESGDCLAFGDPSVEIEYQTIVEVSY